MMTLRIKWLWLILIFAQLRLRHRIKRLSYLKCVIPNIRTFPPLNWVSVSLTSTSFQNSFFMSFLLRTIIEVVILCYLSFKRLVSNRTDECALYPSGQVLFSHKSTTFTRQFRLPSQFSFEKICLFNTSKIVVIFLITIVIYVSLKKFHIFLKFFTKKIQDIPGFSFIKILFYYPNFSKSLASFFNILSL